MKKGQSETIIIIFILVAAVVGLVLFNTPGSILGTQQGQYSIIFDQDKINFVQGEDASVNTFIGWYDGQWVAYLKGSAYYEFNGVVKELNHWDGGFGSTSRDQIYKLYEGDIVIPTSNLETGLYEVNVYVVATNLDDIPSRGVPSPINWWEACMAKIGTEKTPDYIEKLNTCDFIQTRVSDSFSFNVVDEPKICNLWCRITTWVKSLFV